MKTHLSRSVGLFARMNRRLLAGVRSGLHVGQLSASRFDRLGRLLGLRRLLRGQVRKGIQEALNPISLVRYYEFDFCHRQIPVGAKSILDVSSPRLFPLETARALPGARLTLVNPDPDDLSETARLVALLGLDNIRMKNEGLQSLGAAHQRTYDFVSCISVVEHICGDLDDSLAMAILGSAVRPGGVLAVTVPLSGTKVEQDEYYPPGVLPYTGTHNVRGRDGRFFFQRLYTREAIERRLLRSFSDADVHLEWWGETKRHVYRDYRETTLYNWGGDLNLFRSHFNRFASYEEMPGMGVCGIRIRPR